MISIKHSWLSHVQKVGLLLLVAAIIPVFTGLDAVWLAYPYDDSRALQIFAMTFLSVVAVLSICFNEEAHSGPFAFRPENRQALTVLGAVLVPGLLITLVGAPVPIYSLSDAGLLLMLLISGVGVYRALRENTGIADHLTALVALIPLLSILRLLHETWLMLHGGKAGDWQPNFANMRIYDSATLVCLFLLWARPAWLSRPGLTVPVVLVASLYVMTLILDSARSALLAMLLGLAATAVMYRSRLREWTVPAVSVVLGALLHLLLMLSRSQAESLGSSKVLLSGDPSIRNQLWEKAWAIWRSHPLTGIGGGIFGAVQPGSNEMHPHNFPLQMLSEWGVTGLVVMILLCILLRQLWQSREQGAPLLFAGVLAIAADCQFSGVLVYPTTQMLCLWLIALALVRMPASDARQNPYGWQVAAKTVVLVIALAGSTAIWIQHAGDLRCRGCISQDDIGSPRFWQFGRAIHLVPDPARPAP